MKIYTKKGDSGKTSLFGGTRLSKAHIRIQSYGSVDELNSYLGLIRDLCPDDPLKKDLKTIQEVLFSIGSHLAADPNNENLWLPRLEKSNILALEKGIDKMQKLLPELKFFILPGGHSTVSHCHIGRCICRRAERDVVALTELDTVDNFISTYLNRLSDYLFVLARYMGHILDVEEVKWDSRD